MLRPLLLAALTSLVLLSAAPEAAPVRALEPDPNDLCTLLAEAADRQLTGADEPTQSCRATYGADPRISVSVFRAASAGSARDLVNSAMAEVGGTASYLGEAGYEFRSVNQLTIRLARGPYVVSVTTITRRDLPDERMRGLAEQIDQQIEALVSGASEPPGDADAGEPPDAAEGAAPPDDSADIAGVFFGTVLARSLLPRARELIGCPDTKRVHVPGTLNETREEEVDADECPGGADAGEFRRLLRSEIPDASYNESDMASTLYTAILFAGFEGPDGKPLFPSVLGAMPLIKKLGNFSSVRSSQEEERIILVRRFVDMLAARDAAGWEKRFP